MRKLVTWELPWALVGDIVSAQLGNILEKKLSAKRPSMIGITWL